MPRSKRAAAAKAETKIQQDLKTLEESEYEFKSLSRSSFKIYDEREQSLKKKRKNFEDFESISEASVSEKKRNTSEDTVSDTNHGNGSGADELFRYFCDSSDEDPDDSDDDSEPSSEEVGRVIAKEETKSEKKAAAAERRRQHSNRKMVLSRRLSMNFMFAPDSPEYSPLAVNRLRFTPEAAEYLYMHFSGY